MKTVELKEDQIVVSANDFGLLVEDFIRDVLRGSNVVPEWVDSKLRGWWPLLEEYYQRHIQVEIEVAIAMDQHPIPSHSTRKPLRGKELWVQFLKDYRPAKSAYTIEYHCHKCMAQNVKLWRGVHGSPDDRGNKLLCATCLVPDVVVDEEGRAQEKSYRDAVGKEIPGMRTDQVNGWLPAVPVGDTYWGYSSVPSQDVEWWKALPTYPKKTT